MKYNELMRQKRNLGFWLGGNSLTIGLIILLFICLPLVGFYFGTQFVKSTDSIYQKTEWKIYTDPESYLTFQYPTTWRIDFQGKAQDDPDSTAGFKLKKDITLSSVEGKIDIRWVDSFGGACGDGYEKITLKKEVLDVCHETYPDQELWWQISKEFKGDEILGVQIDSSANQPVDKNRETVLKILSTVEFLK